MGYSVVVIGASAGGMKALCAVLTRLPADYGLPICAVQHLHSSDSGEFVAQLNYKVELEVIEPNDKEEVLPGRVYVAPANYHMMFECDGAIALSVDAPVNWSRPSIDVSFESAARAWGAQVIAVILTGANSDGAVGARIIGERSGLLIAQDPSTAESPEMPQAAITEARIKTVLAPSGIGDRLGELGIVAGSQFRGRQARDQGQR